MSIKIVPDELFFYLMARLTGNRFESFAKQIFSVIFGENFIPLGGIHDGGADGVMSSYIQEVQGKADTFIQFSITNDLKTKIKDTIESLKKSGRSPNQIIYATNKAIPKSDQISSEIFQEYSIFVQFRDIERIKNYVNTDEKANSIFYQFFESEIANLLHAASSQISTVGEFAKDPTILVFLNYELKNQNTNDHLNMNVLDALIYWALKDTDPDKDIKLTRSEIKISIEDIFPTAKSILMPNFNRRIDELSNRKLNNSPRLRSYKKSDQFCLPFEMRQILASEASGIVIQQERFLQSLVNRIRSENFNNMTNKVEETCKNLIYLTVHHYFADQGLILSAYLENKVSKMQISDLIVEDIMSTVLSEMEHKSNLSPELFGICLSILREVFYNFTPDEHKYMSYLSKTSCLLVTLQSAPRLLEYFNKMGGNFNLIIGSDMIIKSISEYFLEKEYQQVTNMLMLCRQLGSKLILTEPVLDEVFTHLHATDLEFRNYYFEQQAYIKSSDILSCNRILIRSYLSSRQEKKNQESWNSFINQYLDPDGLKNKSSIAHQSLGSLLMQQFNMIYMSKLELESITPIDKVKNLANELDNFRQSKREELSYNDALLTYATYALRGKNKESGIYDGFGFRTWWLTKETQVLKFTDNLVESELGVPYIMRPEFILNFITLAPKAVSMRKAFINFLPTTAGLQLGQHLSSEVMHSILETASEWAKLKPERVNTMISEKINKLQQDRYRNYIHNLD
jgi:hypothetical protein